MGFARPRPGRAAPRIERRRRGAFERALAIDPGNDQVVYLLAGAYRELGNTNEARRLAERARDGVRPAARPTPSPIACAARCAACRAWSTQRTRCSPPAMPTGRRRSTRRCSPSTRITTTRSTTWPPLRTPGTLRRSATVARARGGGAAEQLPGPIVVRVGAGVTGSAGSGARQLLVLLEHDPEHVEAKHMLAQLGS